MDSRPSTLYSSAAPGGPPSAAGRNQKVFAGEPPVRRCKPSLGLPTTPSRGPCTYLIATVALMQEKASYFAYKSAIFLSPTIAVSQLTRKPAPAYETPPEGSTAAITPPPPSSSFEPWPAERKSKVGQAHWSPPHPLRRPTSCTRLSGYLLRRVCRSICRRVFRGRCQAAGAA